LSPEDLKAVQEFPQLFEIDGANRRRAAKEAAKEKAKQLEAQREAEIKAAQEAAAQAAAAQTAAAPDPEETNETTAGGSLQLGGEPEERHETGNGQGNRNAIAPPGQNNLGAGIFAQNPVLGDDFSNPGLNNRTLTPQQQQQQQMLLSSLKSGTPQSTGLQSNFGPQNHVAPGHARHTSRFSFANDSSSASASIQPVANQKLMSQQSAMMPKSAGPFNQMSQHQPLASQFYTSGVQGPPPGLKATGTPPVSGGGMFAQGHGFATGGLAYGTNTAGRANNGDPIYQDLLRGRNIEGGARLADAGKRESMFPSFLNQHPTTSTPGPTPGVLTFPYGPSPGAYQESGTQKSKKKGKKHRHANTSSSGGGVVDVQDPSILQARLHQGGGMVNQGLYAGGQGGFSSLYANNYGGGAGRW
jgi:CCR4-NOT transcription complex subunit 4